MTICIVEARKQLMDCRSGISGNVRSLVEVQRVIDARIAALRPLAPEFIDGIGSIVSAHELTELRYEYETLVAYSRESKDFLGRYDLSTN